MFREWQRAQRGELGSLLPAMKAARCVLYLLAIFYLLNPGLDYDFRRANPLPPRTKLAVPAFLIEGSRSGDGNGLPNQLPTDNLSNCSPPPVPEEE